ncbi:acyl CoA binding protein-domain-containing protein [Gorgonomyces haynaldii]|nr:acyl CoA binding protein-domain-containing protein [Gorgonomyces haynaldii]
MVVKWHLFGKRESTITRLCHKVQRLILVSDAQSTGNAEFIKAAEDVKNLPSKPSNDQLLELYGLFKQSIVGDNETPAPGMFDLQGKAKHAAWLKLKGTSKADAQAQYIALVKKLQG